MATKKKKLPAKKKAVKKETTVDPERQALVNGNNLLSKFHKSNTISYQGNISSMIAGTESLYRKIVKAVSRAKFENTKPLLQGLERHKRTLAVQEALILSVNTGNPMPLWVELVRTVKWLKNKNK